MVEKNIEKEKLVQSAETCFTSEEEKHVYCSQCGVKVTSSNNFCTNCGYRLSTFENSNSNYETPQINDLNYQRYYPPPAFVNRSSKTSLEWKPIVIGGVIAVGASLLLGFLAGFFLFDASIYTILGVIILKNFVSLFIGGLYAGVKAKNSGGTHGAFAGLTCVFISLPLNILMGLPVDFFSGFWAAIWAMLFAGIGGLIGYAVTKSSKVRLQPISQTYYG